MDVRCEALLNAIDTDPDEVDDLREQLGMVTTESAMRASFGGLLQSTLERLAPDAGAGIKPLLASSLRNPFGNLPLTTSIAFTVLCGSVVFPDQSLVDAGNQILEHAIKTQPGAMVLQTLLQSCSEDWNHFLSALNEWEPIVWSARSQIVERVERSITLQLGVPAAIYTNQGFWHGMMSLFDIDGKHTILDHDEQGMRVQLVW